MRLTLLDKYIQHSAKQNSFTALREWTSLPSRPSHDSTTCTSWSEAFPTLTACWITDCSWVWVCVFICIVVLCLNVQEKESSLAKFGPPFLTCQLELVYVPVCDFLSVFVFVKVFVFVFEKVESDFFVCQVELVFMCLYLYLYILEEESALTKWEVPFLLCQLELH